MLDFKVAAHLLCPRDATNLSSSHDLSKNINPRELEMIASNFCYLWTQRFQLFSIEGSTFYV